MSEFVVKSLRRVTDWRHIEMLLDGLEQEKWLSPRLMLTRDEFARFFEATIADPFGVRITLAGFQDQIPVCLLMMMTVQPATGPQHSYVYAAYNQTAPAVVMAKRAMIMEAVGHQWSMSRGHAQTFAAVRLSAKFKALAKYGFAPQHVVIARDNTAYTPDLLKGGGGKWVAAEAAALQRYLEDLWTPQFLLGSHSSSFPI